MIPLLVRLIAIAGFAIAGWMALSALGGPASAAQPSAPHENAASAPRGGGGLIADRPGSWDDLSSRVQEVGDHPLKGLGSQPGVLPDGSLESGDRPDRVLRTWRDDVAGLRGPVREIEDDPVRYLQKRRHALFDRKDRAVRQLRDLTDAAGVPRVRIPDVRRAPIVSDLAAGVAKSNPTLDGALRPPNAERPEHGRTKAASDEVAAARPGGHGAATAPKASADEPGDRDAGHCAGCQGERRGPLAPADQDEPWTGSSAGHQLAPVAELRSVRSPAIPPGVEPSTFHRTALTDVSAPGGPSVVPD
ncbi:hypothetical protein ETD83_14015 [Actinomadura soli]|uniref:Uncharacterized protein n=1 Tax=Actinomadura soli TaxID=2508997 RepID=A0A5C4JEB5_9ACTN|nr:hypothetical protein [Actinomadura soli]TMR01747.1 hypothetical protein ETD83_14015 [Actinomadura soli]